MFPVTRAEGQHPFPFRIRQLSPPAPMVLPPEGWESRSLPGTYFIEKGGQDKKSKFLAFWPLCALSGNNSVVECDLAKVEVAGSNPVSRSKGGVAKW
jgi:hypothetical protein